MSTNLNTTTEPYFNTLWDPDYTALDYSPLRDEVIDYVKARYAELGIQDDFLQSSAALVFIDALAYTGKLIGQRGEDLVGEVWLPSVQLRENLLKIVNLFGQQAKLPRGAHVNVVAIAKSLPTSTITLPRLFSVKIPGLDGKSYNFELMVEENDYYTRTILPAAIRQTTLEFFQGTSYQDVFQSTGATRQTYKISRSPVIQGSVYVSVHPKPPSLITEDEIISSRILEVPSLVTPLDQLVYRAQVTKDNEVLLHFAIDRFGKVPPRSWYVYVDHRIGGGKEGNVTVGALNKNFVLRDDVGDEISVAFANTDSRGIGGEDEESLEVIKERIPGHIRSTNRLSQTEDYESTLKDALPDEIDSVFALDYQTDRKLSGGAAQHVPQNGVYIWVLPKNGNQLDADQRQMIATTLENLNLIAIQHYIFSADFNDWELRCRVYYSKTTDPSDLEDRIKARLLAEYAPIDASGQQTGKLKFMRVIRTSRVAEIIQSEVGKKGYIEMTQPAQDIDPFTSVPPQFGQVARLDPDRIVLEMTMNTKDE